MMCTNIEQNMTKNMNLIRGVDKNIKKKRPATLNLTFDILHIYIFLST